MSPFHTSAGRLLQRSQVLPKSNVLQSCMAKGFQWWLLPPPKQNPSISSLPKGPRLLSLLETGTWGHKFSYFREAGNPIWKVKSFYLFSLSYCGKIYVTNLCHFNHQVMFSGIKYIHIVVWQTSPIISRMLYPSNTNASFLPPTIPGNHHATLSFYACGHPQFSCLGMSDSLQPRGLQHTRLPCPSPTSGARSNSCSSSRWCHPTISSSVIPFSSCLQSFPAPGSFPRSQFFTSGGQSIGVSASASVLPMNIQDWFPLRMTGLISLQSKGLWRVFSNITVQKHQFFDAHFSSWPVLKVLVSGIICPLWLTYFT